MTVWSKQYKAAYDRERRRRMTESAKTVCDYCRHIERCKKLVMQERVDPICWPESPEHYLWDETDGEKLRLEV